jgi:hypothetical protein
VQEGLFNLFFNETFICERYVQVILGQFFPELTEKERLYGWFQLLPHTALCLCRLCPMSSGIIISSGIWPARSPDLNHYNFFFWGCFEDKVYNSNARVEEELQENIRKEIVNIHALTPG